MNEITFDKSRFHLQRDMENWCVENIGKGGWLFGFKGHEDDTWGIKSMFGHTTFTFVNPEDLVIFKLRWS